MISFHKKLFVYYLLFFKSLLGRLLL